MMKAAIKKLKNAQVNNNLKERETVLIAGGSGLIGSNLVDLLKENYNIHILTRKPQKNEGQIKYFAWDIYNHTMDQKALDCDYIINLNGAGIADARWTNARKKILIESRVQANKTLEVGLRQQQRKIKAIVCASAMGYYGNTGDEWVNEESEVGTGFLAECCRLWEESSMLLKPFCERMCIIRIGLVLSREGGALPKMLMTKQIGILPYFGSGAQFYSWIHIDDLCSMFIHCLQNMDVKGIYNGVSPEPVTNKHFTFEIAKILPGYQMAVPTPAFALRIAMGEMADVVLNSNKIQASRMTINHKFRLQYPDLRSALLDLLD